jgi:Mg/Co/Ni transporter MgtE
MTAFVKNTLIRAALTALLLGTIAALTILANVWGVQHTLGAQTDYLAATAAALAAGAGAIVSGCVSLLSRLKGDPASGVFTD